MDVPRLIRTLRYVPPRALAWRVRAKALQMYYRMPFAGLGALALKAAPHVAFVGPELVPGDVERGKDLALGRFTLAGLPQTLRLPDDTHGMDWFPPRVSPLGIFELHYHEWLADLKAAGARETAQRLVGDWLMQFGSYHPVAWHPYPTSLRLVAWLTHGNWLLEGAPDDMKEAFAFMLARQLAYLDKNCEYDLGGNHLLKNLKALVYGGFALEGQQELRTRALAEFLRELDAQILPDGTHFELSPMYHAQVLRDAMEVRAFVRKATGSSNTALDAAVHKLGTTLAFFCHGDGKLALFNDAAELTQPYVQTLLRQSGADDAPSLLPDAGFARVQRGKTLLLFRAGQVGPDENPGHAHADTLSFELSYGKERIITNQGTYAYQDRLRNTLRGTAAHSTVDVEGQNSAEVWGNFRVGRRPTQVVLDAKAPEGGDVVLLGAHNGYRHLGVRHARKIVVAADGTRLRGEDELIDAPSFLTSLLRLITQSRPPARIMAHFPLHPTVDARLISEQEAELTLPGGSTWRFTIASGRLDMKDSRYAPQFGTLMTSRQIIIHGRLLKGQCKLLWSLERVKA